MRVLVCGGRHFDDYTFVRNALENLLFYGNLIPKGLVIIEGACPTGADEMAHIWATRNNLENERYPVDHALDGPWPAAGPIRNSRMLKKSRPTMGISFPGGKGTADMVKKLKAYVNPDTGEGIRVVELQRGKN